MRITLRPPWPRRRLRRHRWPPTHISGSCDAAAVAVPSSAPPPRVPPHAVGPCLGSSLKRRAAVAPAPAPALAPVLALQGLRPLAAAAGRGAEIRPATATGGEGEGRDGRAVHNAGALGGGPQLFGVVELSFDAAAAAACSGRLSCGGCGVVGACSSGGGCSGKARAAPPCAIGFAAAAAPGPDVAAPLLRRRRRRRRRQRPSQGEVAQEKSC
jgi:hypothetical protein